MDEDIGEKIRLAREARGWSQEFLAAKVGATQSTIDRVESGSTRRSRVLPDIMSVLGLTAVSPDRAEISPKSPNAFEKVSYVLPVELINRIDQYRAMIGVSSEDEAVRRLIDEALKKRDDVNTIVQRLYDKNREMKSLREAAGIAIANHPLVKSMSFDENKISFELTSGFSVEFWSFGYADIRKADGSYYMYHKDVAPRWAGASNITEDYKYVDDIPF